MRLTDRSVATLTWNGKQHIISDDLLPGFGVRVGKNATAFVLTIGQDRKRITLGRYPTVSLAEARQKARAILIDGLTPVPPAPTFKELLDEFLDSRQVRRSTAQKDGYTAKSLESLYSIPLSQLTPDLVDKDIKSQSSPWSRHYAHRLFVLTVRYAQKKGWMENWPTHRLHAKLRQEPRSRTLGEQELRKVMLVAEAWGDHPYGKIVTLLCLTGQRRQQIASLRKDWIDWNSSLINWPAEAMKAGRPHSIPITARVADIMANQISHSGQLLFASGTGSAFTAFSMYTDRFRRDCGFSDWTLHDLRRTYATIHAQLSTPLHIIEKLLSHSYSQLTSVGGIYMRYSYLKEAREACDRYESFIQSLVGNSAD